mmetsp:Transcript_58032/g.164916  ORF Transcript_58032/g.164916 Transcript_58032/m.164916 type:complete len:144 (+) Transcript_58032:75-506(+)
MLSLCCRSLGERASALDIEQVCEISGLHNTLEREPHSQEEVLQRERGPLFLETRDTDVSLTACHHVLETRERSGGSTGSTGCPSRASTSAPTEEEVCREFGVLLLPEEDGSELAGEEEPWSPRCVRSPLRTREGISPLPSMPL